MIKKGSRVRFNVGRGSFVGKVLSVNSAGRAMVKREDGKTYARWTHALTPA